MAKTKSIFIVPYSHCDWAWTANRRWHEKRYVLVLEERFHLGKLIGAGTPHRTLLADMMVTPDFEGKREAVQRLVRDGPDSGVLETYGVDTIAVAPGANDELRPEDFTVVSRYLTAIAASTPTLGRVKVILNQRPDSQEIAALNQMVSEQAVPV